MSDQQQQFCLRWNDFQSNIVTCFKHLRTERSFTDVTLACDGQTTKGYYFNFIYLNNYLEIIILYIQFPAHKMVLSACSPYFKAILEVIKKYSFNFNAIKKYSFNFNAIKKYSFNFNAIKKYSFNFNAIKHV